MPQRSLLTGSVNYIKQWEAGFLSLLLGFDWYYDLAEKNFDHTMTLHIRMDYGISNRYPGKVSAPCAFSAGLSKKQGAG
jgi:hypothetical protein